MTLKREELEKREGENLSSYAVKSSESFGRKYSEDIEDERLCFQRDKDRIIHCKAFRRLNEKTQVFIAGAGDHYRTRLTHTLEVAQISRDIARRMGLNEDLCEAIALAHDLGHTPFGHGGEEVLNKLMSKYGYEFEHNRQSRRIVEKLEKVYPDFDGLNLTFEVLDGLIKHQSPWDQKNIKFETSPHLEAQVVNVADEIAYTNHDIDDGLRSGLIKVEDLGEFELWKMAKNEVNEKYGSSLNKQIFNSRIVSTIISMMIENFCFESEKNIEKNKIKNLSDVKDYNGVLAKFSADCSSRLKPLREFLYKNFYMHPDIIRFVNEGTYMLEHLFNFYIDNPSKFPKDLSADGDDFIIAVKDYIAGMTDGFLTLEFKKLVQK